MISGSARLARSWIETLTQSPPSRASSMVAASSFASVTAVVPGRRRSGRRDLCGAGGTWPDIGERGGVPPREPRFAPVVGLDELLPTFDHDTRRLHDGTVGDARQCHLLTGGSSRRSAGFARVMRTTCPSRHSAALSSAHATGDQLGRGQQDDPAESSGRRSAASASTNPRLARLGDDGTRASTLSTSSPSIRTPRIESAARPSRLRSIWARRWTTYLIPRPWMQRDHRNTSAPCVFTCANGSASHSSGRTAACAIRAARTANDLVDRADI